MWLSLEYHDTKLYNPVDLAENYWIKMKTIEVDEELYRYIASHTLHIGESASEILRRMLKFSAGQTTESNPKTIVVADTTEPKIIPSLKTQKTVDRVRVMRELLLSDEYAEQKRAVNRFMLILTTLYRIAPEEFDAATESLHGRTRVYFANDKATLLENGIHTKPQQIVGTPYWVITNTNSGRKRSMVEHIMGMLQLPAELTDKVCGTI